MKHLVISSLLAGLCSLGAGAHAAGLADTLKGQASGGSGSSALGGMLGGKEMSARSAAGLTGSGTAGNAAGVITYCMKNNYLNADKAAQVKDQLLGKMGLGGQKEAPKDEGYLSGLSGMVTGSGGQTFDLGKVKGKLKEKACDFVLDNAKSLL